MSDFIQGVSILFCDIKGFTSISSEIRPEEVVHLLHGLFSGFDTLTDKYRVRGLLLLLFLPSAALAEPLRFPPHRRGNRLPNV